MPVLQLLFRLSIAGIFLRAALSKAVNWPLTLQLFQDDYRVPLLSASMGALLVTGIEMVCSAMILTGFLTRLATLPLLGMIAAIAIFVSPGASVEHFSRMSILLFLLVRGGGTMSLDHVFDLEDMLWSRFRASTIAGT